MYIYIYYNLYKRLFTTDPLHALSTFLWLSGRKVNSAYAWEIIHLHPCNKSHSYFYIEFVFLTEKCKQGKGFIAA